RDNRVRITADLIRASDDATIWSGRYDRGLGDVVAVQEEICRAIVNELRLNHIGDQRRYTADVDTYDNYLRAETLANEDTPGNALKLTHAIELFQAVIERQPDFAPAYA